MTSRFANNIFHLSDLHNRARVFRDRVHAGELLGGMLQDYTGGEAMVIAIPAGGVPVAAVVAEMLDLPLECAVVSKITLPWNTEAGYGAVAFDGTVRLNESLVDALGLTREQIEQGIERTRTKVTERVQRLRKGKPLPELSQRPAILVDDGLASGFTMQVAMEAVARAGASPTIIAVPTGHQRAVESMAPSVAAVYCANIRGGWSFAVADAYQHWRDVDEQEVARILTRLSSGTKRS